MPKVPLSGPAGASGEQQAKLERITNVRGGVAGPINLATFTSYYAIIADMALKWPRFLPFLAKAVWSNVTLFGKAEWVSC